MLADPPELGNEDPLFEELTARARAKTAWPLLLIVADPPRHDDTDADAEAKAVTAIRAWARMHGATFGGVLPQRQRGQRAAS